MMDRRSWLKSLSLLATAGFLPKSRRALAAATATTAATARASSARHPIVLYCDLAVDPAREQEMLEAFHHHFKPVAEKHPGYIDLKMLRLRQVIQGGPAPARAINYRFQLTYESEELRQKWIASPEHRKYWPMVENTVADKGYLVLLTEEA
jgi:antibiotic biosynthesis monooxygenase (ABM) superfamily enzyme